MKKLLAACLTAFMATAALPTISGALADTTRVQDLNDNEGKLDVKFVVQGHKETDEGRLVRHRLTMHERWGKKSLAGRGNFIHLFFDTDDDRAYERRLKITTIDGKLRAKMQTWKDPETIGLTHLSRPNRHSVAVAFPESWLGDNTESYKWIAATVYGIKGEGACGLRGDVYKSCSDRIPDNRRIAHEI